MRKAILWGLFLFPFGFIGIGDSAAQQRAGSLDNLSQELIAIERAALDRWMTGDPQGYLGIYAPEITYFDPNQDKRIDGLEAMKQLFEPMKAMKFPIKDPRYEMLNPKIQLHGDIALLTFNIISFGKLGDKPEAVLGRWNSTEIYSRIGGEWKIIHSHWSYIKPGKPPTP
ncbi:MAG: DUF4440 domain-containing protein [Acidobacteria bacterium]|nr:MAG: DUF4440 domain-containing protein [Acidobacteriota bacterium]